MFSPKEFGFPLDSIDDLLLLGGWRLLRSRSAPVRNQLVIYPGKFVNVWRQPQNPPIVVENRLCVILDKYLPGWATGLLSRGAR